MTIKLRLPDPYVPLVLPNGRCNAVWYGAFLRLNAIVPSSGTYQPYSQTLTQLAATTSVGFFTFTSAGPRTVVLQGTASRISVTNTTGSGDPIFDIAHDYLGQNSIVNVGILTKGTWNADPISSKYGGTGVDNGDIKIRFTGGYDFTAILTGTTEVTFPTTGTLLGVIEGSNANEVLVTNSLNQPIWDSALPNQVMLNIDTVGTINTGTWNGTLIGGVYGGTFQDNGSDSQLNYQHSIVNLPQNITMTISSAGGDINVTMPTSGTLITSTDVPNPLTLAKGGTGANLTAAAGAIVYSTSSAFALNTPVGTTNSPLLSQGTGAPAYASFTIQNGVTKGDIPYGSADNALSMLPKNTNATRYLSNTGTDNVPAWAQVNVANGVIGTLPVANGGTGDASVTAYAVLCGGTTSTGAFQSIASVGTVGQVLTSNGPGALPTFQASGGGGGSSSWAHDTYTIAHCGALG